MKNSDLGPMSWIVEGDEQVAVVTSYCRAAATRLLRCAQKIR
jgi:hypothetical protein